MDHRVVATSVVTAFVLLAAACGGAVSDVVAADESTPADSAVTEQSTELEEEGEEEVAEDGLGQPDLSGVSETIPAGTIVERPCPSSGFCGEGFILNGQSYDRVCLVSALDAAVSEQQVGEGVLFGEKVSVRRVVGQETDSVLVIDLSCDGSDDWFFLAATDLSVNARNLVFCEAGQADDDLHQRLCGEGG